MMSRLEWWQRIKRSPCCGLTVFLGLAVVSFAFQIGSGAWSSDFGGHADEGAHVVTSLMVRDYLAGGWMEEWHPMRYAESYYECFPKVAIGHYPPAFYVVASLFLLPFRTPEVFPVLMALLNALAGWVTWRLGEYLLKDRFAAICAGGAVCLLPLTRMYTVTVMADSLLTIFCLCAVYGFARFLEDRRARDSILFGVFAAFAILTKASGIALALLPVPAILLAGEWKVLTRPRLWLAPIPVLLLALPWTIFTWKISAEGIYQGDWGDYVRNAVPFYFRGIVLECGWILIPVLAGALGFVVLGWFRGRPLSGKEASVFSFPICVLAIVVLVPTGVDHRYLLPAAPALILVGVWSCELLLDRVSPGGRRACLAALVVLVLLTSWRVVEKRYTGASEVIGAVLDKVDSDRGPSGSCHALVISDATGEGALTAAAAFKGRERLSILRGTKTLATSDWMGRGYELAFESPKDFSRILAETETEFVIVEAVPKGVRAAEHWQRAASILSGETETKIGELKKTFPSLRKRGIETEFLLYHVSTD